MSGNLWLESPLVCLLLLTCNSCGPDALSMKHWVLHHLLGCILHQPAERELMWSKLQRRKDREKDTVPHIDQKSYLHSLNIKIPKNFIRDQFRNTSINIPKENEKRKVLVQTLLRRMLFSSAP